MRNHLLLRNRVYTFVTAFTISLHSFTALADIPPEAMQQNGISYVTGGIGDEDFKAMKATQHLYNVRVLSVGTNGAYPGDTHIIISDTHGRELINTDADPLFYAQMQPGQYIVEESSDGQSSKKNIVVTANKPSNMTFRWQ